MRHFRSLYVQVLLAIVGGALLGHLRPELGVALKPLADGFLKVIKAVTAPLLFTTLVSGIGNVGDLRKVGRVGIKALLYFEGITTVALGLGLLVVNWVQPGAGLHARPESLDSSVVQGYAAAAKKLTVVEFLLGIIPDTMAGAFVSGEMLPVLFLSVLVGVSISRMGERARPILDLVHLGGEALMGIVSLVMRFAPVAAFGAMAFTLGKFGIRGLMSLGWLLLCVYLTCGLFVFGVLGLVLRWNGFRLLRLLYFLREELMLVLGTSSSESALPRMLQRMEELGCSPAVTGLVLPAGYSFNLDGTCIYLTMAAVFIGQATDTPLPLGSQLGLLALLLLTSKGAAAITGGGFVTLSATLSATGTLPVAGLSLLVGVDRFMSEIRALTNLVGNATATLVIARWEGALDEEKSRVIRGRPER
jgi:aerobic C4-dicarboxylate transport protein